VKPDVRQAGHVVSGLGAVLLVMQRVSGIGMSHALFILVDGTDDSEGTGRHGCAAVVAWPLWLGEGAHYAALLSDQLELVPASLALNEPALGPAEGNAAALGDLRGRFRHRGLNPRALERADLCEGGRAPSS
jgi:hypothetical protein